MSIDEREIHAYLEGLKERYDLLAQLREQVKQQREQLSQAKRDYEQRLGKLNAEAERLEALRASWQARLNGREPGGESEKTDPEPIVTPPAIIPVIGPVDEGPLLSQPAEDPRSIRKRRLADHIFYFIGHDQQDVLQKINALLHDGQRDVGDILEILPWGEIWTVRTDWDTLDTYYARLSEWDQALQERLTHWQREISRIERDSWYALMEKMRASNSEEWHAYLDEAARKQAEENAELAKKVAVMERVWQARRSGRGAGND